MHIAHADKLHRLAEEELTPMHQSRHLTAAERALLASIITQMNCLERCLRGLQSKAESDETRPVRAGGAIQ